MIWVVRNFVPHRVGFYVGIIVVWQVVAMTGIWPENIFPSPYEVAEDLAYGAYDGSLFYGIATSMWRLVVGLGIAIVGGIILGIFMARVEAVNQTVGSLVLGLQSIPSVAWVPLAILWFGLNDAGIIFVTAVGAVFAVTINTYTGVKNIDRPPLYRGCAKHGRPGEPADYRRPDPCGISLHDIRIQAGMGVCLAGSLIGAVSQVIAIN